MNFSPKTLGLIFAIATAIFWGLYGPSLGQARFPPRTPGDSPFKAFVFIGLAYLLWGVIGGLMGIGPTGGTYSFAPKTITWGFIAGSLGAFGALTLTYAMFASRGAAELVMPVVFGGATTVAVLTSLLVQGHLNHIKPPQIVGFVLVVVGVVLIQAFASHGPAVQTPKPAAHSAEDAPREAT